uniref:Uncharacterized protein n=1 Tax=Anguilla anguilla TaxID=7936 RepID=A0A0E9VI03_ANGAN
MALARRRAACRRTALRSELHPVVFPSYLLHQKPYMCFLLNSTPDQLKTHSAHHCHRV